MTTTGQSNSLDLSSPKTSTSDATCNICKRLLYPFEEVLRCEWAICFCSIDEVHLVLGRICSGAYHWRCLKPQRVSRYGQNENYVCANCSDGVTTTTNSSYRSSNGLNQTESFETNERDLNDGALRRTSEETFRHYENTPSLLTSKTTHRTEFDDYSSLPTNGNHYQHQNSKINKEINQIYPLFSSLFIENVLISLEEFSFENDIRNRTKKKASIDYRHRIIKFMHAVSCLPSEHHKRDWCLWTNLNPF